MKYLNFIIKKKKKSIQFMKTNYVFLNLSLLCVDNFIISAINYYKHLLYFKYMYK